MTTDNRTDKSAYVALGMMLGVVAGMLLAPRSGEEMRSKIREQAMSAKRKVGEQVSEKGKTAMRIISKSLEKSRSMTDNVASQAQATSDKAGKSPDSAGGELQEQAPAPRRRG